MGPARKKKLTPVCIVGIGGSAGALNAYKTLLDHLPPDTGMAFVVISHMNPDAYSQLAQILARHTKMPALVASAAMPINANHVYVIPANADLEVEKYKFKVNSPRRRRNVQIDVFFASIARALGERAIGVVLSGYDGDGTAGCKHIKEKGGITFAQDESAEVDSILSVRGRQAMWISFYRRIGFLRRLLRLEHASLVAFEQTRSHADWRWCTGGCGGLAQLMEHKMLISNTRASNPQPAATHGLSPRKCDQSSISKGSQSSTGAKSDRPVWVAAVSQEHPVAPWLGCSVNSRRWTLALCNGLLRSAGVNRVELPQSWRELKFDARSRKPFPPEGDARFRRGDRWYVRYRYSRARTSRRQIHEHAVSGGSLRPVARSYKI